MAKGDHLTIASTLAGIPFQHHGIDMGDGTVVHLAPENGPRVTLRDESGEFAVRRDSMEEFCRGQIPEVIRHTDRRDPNEVVAAAESMLGKTGYSLLDGNCEHFATLCATGRHESHQIEMSEATVAAVTSMATKAVWSLSSRVAGRFALRSAMRVHPAAMLADGVEVAALTIGCRTGMSAEKSRRLAKISGTVAAAGIGGVLGGPGGAAICVAAHSSSSAIGDRICKTVRMYLAGDAKTVG